jgi:glycosyl transferase family 1
MREIILEGQTGMPVPPGDPVALAETVIGLLRRPELLREMGQRGRRHARERFTWPRVARRVDARLRHPAGFRAAPATRSRRAARSLGVVRVKEC